MRITLVPNYTSAAPYGTAEVPDGTERLMWKGKLFVFQFAYGSFGPFVEQFLLQLPDDAVLPPE